MWEEDVFLYNNVRTIEVYLIKRIKLYFIHIHCHKDCLASLGRCTLVPSASLTKTPSRSDHSVLPGRAAGARGLGEARKELSPSAIMCAVDSYVKTSQLITSETKNTEVICVL